MKKYGILIILISLLLSGCGWVEYVSDNISYSTIVGKKGNITIYSGGIPVKTYFNVTILSKNTKGVSSLLFITEDGEKKYYTGDVLFEY